MSHQHESVEITDADLAAPVVDDDDALSSATLQCLLEAAPEPMLIVGSGGVILRSNAAANRVLRVDPEALRGRGIGTLLAEPTEAHAELLATLTLGDAEGAPAPLELAGRRSDGSVFAMQMSAGRLALSEPCYVIVARDVSRRRMTADALARSEANLRMAQRLAKLGSFECILPDDIMVFASDEFLRLIGRKPGEPFTPSTFTESVVHPSDRGHVLDHIRKVLASGERLTLKFRIVRPDGTVRNVESELQSSPIPGLASHRLSGTLQDMTDAAQAHAAISRERDRAQRYLDLVPVIVMAFDRQGNITMINNKGCRLLGYREDELLGRSFVDLCIPEDVRPQVTRRFESAMAGSTWDWETEEGPLITASGAPRLVAWRSMLLRNALGQITGSLSAGEDVTARREMEDQLRQTEEELRLTFQHAPIGMATVAPDLRITSVNQAFCMILGYTEAEFIGRRPAEFIHPDDQTKTDEMVEKLLNGEVESTRQEKRYLHKNGSLVHGVVRNTLVRDARGRPIMFIAQIVDHTNQVRAEIEASQQRERLAHVARLGTMGEMAAGIAHELNQPLAAIANYTRACQRLSEMGELDTEELESVLGKVTAQAMRAGEVIRGLRTLSRRGGMARTPTEPGHLLKDVIMLGQLDARAHGIELRFADCNGWPLVQVDPIQIQQVLLNLIRNAVDATIAADSRAEGIELDMRQVSDEELEIRVIDHGIGVDPAIEDRLFDPFFTTKREGVGIGLSLCRSIIEVHGGGLRFTRNPGGGTIFHVVLPTLPEHH